MKRSKDKNVGDTISHSIKDNSSMDDMQHEMRKIILLLLEENDKFDPAKTFEKLIDYIKSYNRILYSIVSNNVFSLMGENQDEKNEEPDKFGTLQSNIEILITYIEKPENFHNYICNAKKEEKKYVHDAKKSVWKIWDHINLAQRQYVLIYSSYDQRINEKFNKYKLDISKDLNSQMITIVSIFTALAFLLFGGISSLENLFTGLSGDNYMLRILIISCIWTLGILNIVFVFLYCTNKMTKLSFDSISDDNATIWLRYPIIWWTDFVLISMMTLFIWLYFCKNRGFFIELDQLFAVNLENIAMKGILIILGIVLVLAIILYFLTKHKENNEDK